MKVDLKLIQEVHGHNQFLLIHSLNTKKIKNKNVPHY